MRWRAQIRRPTGPARGEGTASNEAAREVTQLEIAGTDGAVLLLQCDASGQSIWDTWHQTIDEAKDAAREEFELADWLDVDA